MAFSENEYRQGIYTIWVELVKARAQLPVRALHGRVCLSPLQADKGESTPVSKVELAILPWRGLFGKNKTQPP